MLEAAEPWAVAGMLPAAMIAGTLPDRWRGAPAINSRGAQVQNSGGTVIFALKAKAALRATCPARLRHDAAFAAPAGRL